jgi:hypothetical protein
MIARKLLIGTISSIVAVVGTSSIVFAGVAFVEHRQEIPAVSTVSTVSPVAMSRATTTSATPTSATSAATAPAGSTTSAVTAAVADDWGGATTASDDVNATDDKAKTQVEAVQVSPTTTTVPSRSSEPSTAALAGTSTTSTTICDAPGDGVADDGAAHDATDDKGGAAGGHGKGHNDVAAVSTTPITSASTSPSNTVPSVPATSAEVHGGRGKKP